jgi:hypothetical protein
MRRTLLRLSLAAIAVAGFCGCRNSMSGLDPEGGTIVKPSAARPVLTYYGVVKKGTSMYSVLCVMDADGRDQTSLLRATDTNVRFLNPSWSPTGKSICVIQSGMGVVPDSLKAVDINVGPTGDLVCNNIRTIVGCSKPGSIHASPSPFGETVGYPRWSSTSAMGKIAYSSTNGGTIQMCVVPEAGGTPQVIWSGGAWEDYLYCAWSPDDSRLAVHRIDGGYGHNIIMIYNTSTWKCVDSISVTGMIWGLDWSRNGMNKLAFGRSAMINGTYYLSYCDPKTGAATTTNGIIGGDPSWAPDNSSLVCWGESGLTQVTPFTHKSSVISSSVVSSANWMR